MSILKRASDKGIINVEEVRRQLEEMEKQELLNMHPYSIRQDERGMWATYLPAEDTKHKRKAVKRKNKSDLEKVIIEYYKEKVYSPTFSECFYIWANKKLKYGEITKGTFDRYETTLKRYFSGENDFKVKNIDEEELEDFIKNTIYEKQLTQKMWANLRILINGVFKYAKKQGLTEISITAFMGDLDISRKAFKQKRTSKEESIFTDVERDKIISRINSNPTLVGLAIVLAFETGMRCGEILALKYSDLDGNILHVRRTEERFKDENGKCTFIVRESTKGRDVDGRDIVLSDSAIRTIKRVRILNPFGQYMFEKNGERISGGCLTRRLYKLCDLENIPRRSIHKARKTYASTLHKEKVPDKLIQQQLGHKQFSTTMEHYIYNSYTDEESISIIKKAISTF